MLQDLRFGLKLLWKEKAFTITALLTLALCIGVNTAIFTVLHAVILDPLPYPEPDRIVTLFNVYPGVGVTERGSNAIPDYLDRRKLTDVFESLALFGSSGYDVGAAGSPARIEGLYVTPSYFQVLRAKPMFGRTFTEDDAVLGKEKSVILSYGLWKEMFSGDRNVLIQNIRLSGESYRIVGVMPKSFEPLERDCKLWVPFAFTPKQTSDDARHSNNWNMIARLPASVSVGLAQQRIDALNRENLERFPKYRQLLIDARFATKVVGLKDETVRDIRPTLYLLQAAVAFVLLIGCVNVANLMLVRSNIRMKEIAIRFSLGASRIRLARQLMTESIVLAMIGGALSLAVGYACLQMISSIAAENLPRGGNIQMDSEVLAFSAAISLLTGLIFGSVPVFHLFRRDLNAVFRQTERTGTSERGMIWTRSALVVSQVALAFVLLIGSGLLTLSFQRVLAVKPGFSPENVLTAQIALPQVRYKEDTRARTFVATLLENIRSFPGVTGAGVTTYLPFGHSSNSSVITIVGHTLAPGENPPVPGWNNVDSGYFQAMGIPLLQGRLLSDNDTADTPKVAVIDQFLAKKYWPAGDAIGSKVREGIESIDAVVTIVGIVGSVKVTDLADRNPVGLIYFPYKQSNPRYMTLIVKAAREDPQLISYVRQAVQRADPELPVFDMKTMPERLAASLLNRRAAMVLCLVFAGLALSLSAIGIYGVLAYSVTQRTREFGIRVALGAGARNVIGMVVFHGLKLAVVGLALGLVVALAVTRLMTNLLYDVQPTEVSVFLSVGTVLALVALIASFIPSLRAVRIPPAVALRYE